MKIKALADFNLGSMEANHRAGDVLSVSLATGKELIDAGLAVAVPGEAADKESSPAKARETKPEPLVLKTK